MFFLVIFGPPLALLFPPQKTGFEKISSLRKHCFGRSMIHLGNGSALLSKTKTLGDMA